MEKKTKERKQSRRSGSGKEEEEKGEGGEMSTDEAIYEAWKTGKEMTVKLFLIENTVFS